jgi:hypothetical protein
VCFVRLLTKSVWEDFETHGYFGFYDIKPSVPNAYFGCSKRHVDNFESITDGDRDIVFK